MSGEGERVSWFDQHGQNSSISYKFGTRNKAGLVATIFFPTGSAQLDDDDRAVLDAMISNVSYRLVRIKLQLQMIGYADPRGTEPSNYHLGLHRANAVKHYVDAHIDQTMKSRGYSSILQSIGETEPSGHWAYDRRVDVYSSFVPKRPHVVLPPTIITGNYEGPLSDRFEFRVLSGGSVGIGPLAGQVVSIEIRNPRTNQRAGFTYTGGGVGANLGVNRPTDWTEMPVGAWLDVDDFEGTGRVGAAGVGYGGTVFVFDGPKDRGKSSESISLGFDGWDLNVGFQGDVLGYWHKRN